jgi:hypothetical protein
MILSKKVYYIKQRSKKIIADLLFIIIMVWYAGIAILVFEMKDALLESVSSTKHKPIAWHCLEIPKNDEKQNMRFFEKIVCEFIRNNKVCEKNSMRM